MVTPTIRAGYNVNQCRCCGRTNADCGEWYWVTTDCDVCSDCAPGRHIMIARTYRLTAGQRADGKVIKEQQRRNVDTCKRPLELVPVHVSRIDQ